MSSFLGNTHLYLTSIFAKNFRNIDQAEINFGPGHNLFVGHNGQGKTNFLESIAMACSLRPLQSLHNVDLIKFNEVQAKIMASFHGAPKIEIDIFPNGKKARQNDHPLQKASSLAKSSPLVSFIPIELNMVTGPGSLRRHAIDQAAASLFAEHTLALKAYEKLLLHRNRLLKDWPIDRETLSTFTDMLIREGATVIFYRLQAIEALLELFSETIDLILGFGQSGTIRYMIGGQDVKNHTIADLMAVLSQHKAAEASQELRRKITLFGPHLDDIALVINGQDAKKTASRGQTRAIVLAFKLAQMMAIHRIRGIAPIIILDDIVSEFDADKKRNLIKVIHDLRAQAFFSATDILTFGESIDHQQIYHVSNGAISRQ